MPSTFTNDIDFVEHTKYIVPPSKVAKKPPPEPWALPTFTPLQIDDYNDPGEPQIPPSLNRHNPLALFRLFFTDKIMDKMVKWINAHADAHAVTDADIPLERPCP